MCRFIILFIFSVFTANVSTAATFSGTIQLPAGVTAGASGTQFEISTQFIEVFTDSNGFLGISSDDAYIPPFGTSASFSFQLPANPNFSTHNIVFECETGCESLDATTSGFWNESQGVVGSFLDATDYSSTSDQTINIVLEGADTFGGTVSFPEGFTATGDEQIVIRVRESTFFTIDSYPQYLYPNAGETNFSFSIGVPTSGAASAWEVEFYCNSCDQGIIEDDHFPTTAQGNPATLNEADQFIFSKANDYTNITLTLMAVQPKSTTTNIIGAISILLDD